jgi:uroporphyrinogen decarboxylase
MNPLQKLVNESKLRIGLPLAVYPGIHITGAKVSDVVNDAHAQFEASAAIHKRYNTPIVLTAMDLSVEAEAFGCPLFISDNEIPTVSEPIISDRKDIENLRVPEIGEKRTNVYLSAAKLLKNLNSSPLVFGGTIGPFSLACRLAGMNEVLCYTMESDSYLNLILEKCSMFLRKYISAFKTAGADGVIIAEPAAGLLSPSLLNQFSSSYIRQIIDGIQDEQFSVILHNCSAKIIHLQSKISAGTVGLHFGSPMDILEALKNSPSDIILLGNLDPASVFLKSIPDEVYKRTGELLEKTSSYINYIISSGCDVPPTVPLENIDAFFQACSEFNKKKGNK